MLTIATAADMIDVLPLVGKSVSFSALGLTGKVNHVRINGDDLRVVMDLSDNGTMVTSVVMVDGKPVPACGSLLWKILD